jgi:RHS repeat-associated protein
MPPLAERDCPEIAPVACEDRADLEPAPTVDAGQLPAPVGRYGWAAHDYDTATGLQYNCARHYCPAVGQWTTEDPAVIFQRRLQRFVKVLFNAE